MGIIFIVSCKVLGFRDLITLGQGSGPKEETESCLMMRWAQCHRIRLGAGRKQATPHLTLYLWVRKLSKAVA